MLSDRQKPMLRFQMCLLDLNILSEVPFELVVSVGVLVPQFFFVFDVNMAHICLCSSTVELSKISLRI